MEYSQCLSIIFLMSLHIFYEIEMIIAIYRHMKISQLLKVNVAIMEGLQYQE